MSSRSPTAPQRANPLAPHLEEARRLSRCGQLVLLLGAAPVAAWLALAPLSSAVVAQAFVKIDLGRRPVQHPEGGIVSEVRVRDGQLVAAGEPLLVLGDVAVDAELNRLEFRTMTERASLARLQAEELRRPALTFPPDLVEAAAADPRLKLQLDKEHSLFNARRAALTSQVALLHAQRQKVLDEVDALKAQIERAAESYTLQRVDLENQRKLVADGFISASRIAQLDSALADYGVKLEERRGEAARARQRLIDTDLRINALQTDYRQQASDQIKLITARLGEVEQELRKSADAAARQVIVAPMDGEVMNLQFSSPGAVVSPREPIADIVPVNPRLVIEAQLRTEDVSRVEVGQKAGIRFTAYRYRTTQLVDGKVFHLAADRSVDPATNQPYYVALIEADPASLSNAGNIEPQAGMPAEVYLEGEERTPLRYLVEPLTDLMRHAGRED